MFQIGMDDVHAVEIAQAACDFLGLEDKIRNVDIGTEVATYYSQSMSRLVYHKIQKRAWNKWRN